MDYLNDVNGRYLAMVVLKNKKNEKTGIPYDKAITSPKSTKEAIDWWIIELEKVK